MKLIRKSLILSFVLLSLYSCTVDVSSSVDESKIQAYKTYAWVTVPYQKPEYNRESRKKVLDLDIKKEIDREMAARGFVMDTVKPDILISQKAVFEKQDNSADLSWTKPGFNSSTYGSNAMQNTNMVSEEQNVLKVQIEFIDPASRQAVWTGSKSRILGSVMQLTGFLEKDVKAIFKKFPIEKKK
ncbi:MAG: DUF4136 domain-containing protein [Cytophagaceae bacterium]|nr:DUF4136 domain-containing protein [Cytophagaceae bacterium]